MKDGCKPVPGDPVRVKSAVAIYRTLDERGCLDGMPFMPEMLAYCGMIIPVWRRVERVCVEGDRMRRLRGMLFLGELRCNGSAHGGCEKGCRIFWHESWVESPERAQPAEVANVSGEYPYPVHCDDRYVCQSTELLRATSRISRLNPGQYVRDVMNGSWRWRDMLRFVGVAIRLRMRILLGGMQSVKPAGCQTVTPVDCLNLQPGEWVRVRSRSEIAATLDRRGRNRGLDYSIYMLPFFGRAFRVRQRVNRIILETNGQMRDVSNTVTLACATCNGHGRWGGCPRDQFHLWREGWLERISPRMERVDDDRWDELVASHPDGTPYHLSGWRRSLEATFSHIKGHFYKLPNGDGVAVYDVAGWLLGRRTVSVPFATKCGVLKGNANGHRDLSDYLRAICDQHRSPRFELRAQSMSHAFIEQFGFDRVSTVKHHYVALDGGIDHIWKNLSRTNVRQRVRRAGQEGLIARHEHDAGGLVAFYDLFAATRRRLGLPVIDYSFFRNVGRYMPGGSIMVVIARRGNVPEAALYALRHRDTLHFEYSGSAPGASASGANQLVWWSALAWACEHGLREVSFGCTDPANQSLLAYKRHWGAVEEDLVTLVCDLGGRMRSGARRGVKNHLAMRSFFRHAPLPVHRMASRLIYRHWG